MAHSEQGVVELVDAEVPADQGLSSLGLLMQLAGNLFAAYAGLIAFTVLFETSGSGQTLSVLVLLTASIARSLLHRAAGTQLLYGQASFEHSPRLAGVRRYVGFALVQTLLVGAILIGKLDVGGKLALGIVAGLAVWPVALAVMLALPRFHRFQVDLPVTEDKGFEGASILMTVLGMCGLVAGGSLLLLMLDLPGRQLTAGPGVPLALALALLVVRSLLHVQAGMSGLRETSIDRSVELANRYANYGVISSFCVGGVLVIFVMSTAMSVSGLALICGVCWMLMAWPLIVRRFFSDRQFADLLAGDQAPLHRRAPDAGLTGLGWLLVAHAAFSASILMPELFAADGVKLRELQAMVSISAGFLSRSMWFSVGALVLQAWAGYELIRMSPHRRIVASVFGVVGAATTIYVQWPVVQELMRAPGLASEGGTAMYGVIAISLILPLATLVLVNRKIAPSARARFRAKR